MALLLPGSSHFAFASRILHCTSTAGRLGQTQVGAPSESSEASPTGKGRAAGRMSFRRQTETNDAKLATPRERLVRLRSMHRR